MRIAQVAADKTAGMTLDELGRLVQEAMRADIPGTARVKAVVGFRGQAKEISVEEVHE